MRYFLVALCICVAMFAKAQFSFNANAGSNYSYVHITTTAAANSKFRGGFGWQLGAGTEYKTGFGYFLYVGANFASRNYKRDSAYNEDTVYTYSYHPLFINIPFGVGYKYPINKNLNLKFYVGLNTQVGAAGKIRKEKTFYSNPNIDPNADGSLVTETVDKVPIQFGDKVSRKGRQYNFSVSNWGINPGIGLDFQNSFEAKLSYSYSFTNFLPGKRAAAENYKLRMVELNLKMDFPNQWYSAHKKK